MYFENLIASVFVRYEYLDSSHRLIPTVQTHAHRTHTLLPTTFIRAHVQRASNAFVVYCIELVQSQFGFGKQLSVVAYEWTQFKSENIIRRKSLKKKSRSFQVMKNINRNKLHQDDNSLLLQKFNCRPCSVQLFDPKMAPKKHQTVRKVTEDHPMRITRRREKLGEAIVVEQANPENSTPKIVSRRVSIAEPAKSCKRKVRSVKLSDTGNLIFISQKQRESKWNRD